MIIREVKINPDLEDCMEIFVEGTVSECKKIEEYFQSDQIDQISSVCHTMLGSAATYGFDQLDELVRELQVYAKEGKLPELEKSIANLKTYVDFIEKNYSNE